MRQQLIAFGKPLIDSLGHVALSACADIYADVAAFKLPFAIVFGARPTCRGVSKSWAALNDHLWHRYSEPAW